MLLQENHLAVTGSFPPVENRTAVARGLLGVGVDYMVGLQLDALWPSNLADTLLAYWLQLILVVL
jgi:hypothetical protein